MRLGGLARLPVGFGAGLRLGGLARLPVGFGAGLRLGGLARPTFGVSCGCDALAIAALELRHHALKHRRCGAGFRLVGLRRHGALQGADGRDVGATRAQVEREPFGLCRIAWQQA